MAVGHAPISVALVNLAAVKLHRMHDSTKVVCSGETDDVHIGPTRPLPDSYYVFDPKPFNSSRHSEYMISNNIPISGFVCLFHIRKT